MNLALKSERISDVDGDDVKINDTSAYAIFDSGSTLNIITSALLSTLNNIKIQFDEIPMKITLLNGDTISTNQKVRLTCVYNNQTCEAWFWIIDKGVVNLIFSHELIKKLKTKKFPIECTIPVNNSKIISITRPFKSFKEKQEFMKLIEKMENKGHLESSTSNWLNPTRLTYKDSGELRFTLDLRELNKLVDLDEFSIPNMAELLRTLHDMSIFSKIDLKDGYFQVPLKKEDREKTTFLTPDNRVQFTVMPQGFKNSPAIFSRGMSVVLEGLIGRSCIVYLDDILIYGKDQKEHDENLNLVLGRIKEYGLQINDKKSIYNQMEISFF